MEINRNVLSLEVADSSPEEEMDLVDMVDAGKPRGGIFDVYYPWDNEAQSQRSTPGFQSPPVVKTCSRGGDANHICQIAAMSPTLWPPNLASSAELFLSEMKW